MHSSRCFCACLLDRSSDLPKSSVTFLSFSHTRQLENLCVCVAFFFNRKDSHGALAIKQLWHRVLNQELPRLTRSDRKGSTMFKRSSVAPSPCLRSFSPAPSGSAGRCGGGAMPHRSWSRCRTPGQDLRSPGGLGDSKGCGMHIHQPSHLGHFEKRVAAAGFTFPVSVCECESCTTPGPGATPKEVATSCASEAFIFFLPKSGHDRYCHQ